MTSKLSPESRDLIIALFNSDEITAERRRRFIADGLEKLPDETIAAMARFDAARAAAGRHGAIGFDDLDGYSNDELTLFEHVVQATLDLHEEFDRQNGVLNDAA